MSDLLKFMIIHGPNLNLLGKREPKIYGNLTLSEINDFIIDFAGGNNCSVSAVQSNSQGAIIDYIHEAMGEYDGLIINPGAYSHYSLAIHDAISASNLPTVEVHLSNIYSREEFRRKSVIAPACIGQISGLGWRGYLYALQYLIDRIRVS